MPSRHRLELLFSSALRTDVEANDNTVLGAANPASSNYVGNAGWPSYATGFDGERSAPGTFNGIIPLEHPSEDITWHGTSRSGFGQITDGTSNTAMLSERLVQTASTSEGVTNGDSRLGSRHILERFETLDLINTQLTASHTHVFESAFIGRSWSSGFSLAAPTYMHVKRPNTLVGHYGTSRDQGDFVVTPSSRHPGGVNQVRADASVHFVSNNIGLEPWWALGSRNDGRVTDLSN